jgi:hypothetical protein
VASAKETFEAQDADAVAAKEGWLLAEVRLDVDCEWFHRPDVYFHVDHAATATRSSSSRVREAVGPCFCADLCLEKTPPTPPEPGDLEVPEHHRPA